MLIAHLPAGWLLARRLAPRLARDAGERRRLVILGLAASVLPDVDLLYFYLVDGRGTLHHDYWTHVPAFWPVLLTLAAATMALARMRVPWRDFAVVLAGVFLHLVLDTVAGGVAWLYPWDLTRFVLTEVPTRFDGWVWNFVLHWSFLLEVAILAWAALELRPLLRIRDLSRQRREPMLATSHRRQERME
ncbi:MAG TPA: metal-dependent hydrolase [Alphaproteobacteria bacterium]|nr:metal-dependent hydrolase [Alphaproteobacteria bacterium]